MKYIKKYKTINDYNADVEEGKLIEGEPYVSYVLSDLSSGDDVVFGIKEPEPPVIEPLTMWIDDYWDGIDLIVDGVEYNTMEEYLTALVNSEPNYNGANKYCFTGETIEYEGSTYYLWQYQKETEWSDNPIEFVLTNTVNFNELYSLSIENNVQNRNCPIYVILRDDKRFYKKTNYASEDYVLLKVEKTNEE